MTLHRQRQPLTLWLALLIAVFGALTPTRSHPHVGSQGEVLAMAVCTSTGMCWLVAESPAPDASSWCSAQMDQTDIKDAPAAGRIWDHCPLCLIFGVFSAPTAQILKADFAGPSALALPRLEHDFFHAAFVAPSPPSRGPPIF